MDVARMAYCARARARDRHSSSHTALADPADGSMSASLQAICNENNWKLDGMRWCPTSSPYRTPGDRARRATIDGIFTKGISSCARMLELVGLEPTTRTLWNSGS